MEHIHVREMHVTSDILSQEVGGSETILLVDDEELIRELGAKILKRAGYKVMKANDGMQALETYSHSKESRALVLLDLMMPRMGGKQCLDILLRFDSNKSSYSQRFFFRFRN